MKPFSNANHPLSHTGSAWDFKRLRGFHSAPVEGTDDRSDLKVNVWLVSPICRKPGRYDSHADQEQAGQISPAFRLHWTQW